MIKRTILLTTGIALIAIHAVAAPRVSLTSSVASPQPLGSVITLFATAKDANPGMLDYRFRIGLSGQALRVVKDFQADDVFDWVPYLREGQYVIEVTARNRSTHEAAIATNAFQLTPRTIGNSAVVTPTRNRLVFLYSAPACRSGSLMRVRFWSGDEPPQYTPYQNCEAGLTRNFYIAGLRASTEYQVTHEVKTGNAIVAGKELTFTTHTLPADLFRPAVTVPHPLDSAGCQSQPVLLQEFYATDLLGRVIWYLPSQKVITRPLRGGGVAFLNGIASASVAGEMDLAGNVVRETNAARISDQLKGLGRDPIVALHHEVLPLPGDHIMTLGEVRRVLTNVQAPGDVTVIGSMLIELDENLQVVWTWNEFDHLDTHRKAIPIGVCAQGGGCPALPAGEQVEDWTHTNSISYTSDGNLIVSPSAQDWVIKIDYQNGKGSGRILWRLGKDGDFTLDSPDPNSWFSHQHDPEFDVPGSPVLSLYDNGWVRHDKDSAAHSRGQVYILDEAQRTAKLLVNADLGVWASAFGSAQRLCNGGYSFNSGNIQGLPQVRSRTTELLPDGSTAFVAEHSWSTYRSFRMKSLYEQ